MMEVMNLILDQPHGEYTDEDIAIGIIPAYFTICQDVGVDPVLAIAQMILETGNLTSFWSARPRRNPAGIGVTGEPGAGVSFPSWANDAIPAHVGRLLAYALPVEQGTPTQQALIAKAVLYRPFPRELRGTASMLRQLGAAHNPTGRGWATPGTDYGARIAEIANRIAR
jgi:hypothetical protein